MRLFTEATEQKSEELELVEFLLSRLSQKAWHDKLVLFSGFLIPSKLNSIGNARFILRSLFPKFESSINQISDQEMQHLLSTYLLLRLLAEKDFEEFKYLTSDYTPKEKRRIPLHFSRGY